MAVKGLPPGEPAQGSQKKSPYSLPRIIAKICRTAICIFFVFLVINQVIKEVQLSCEFVCHLLLRQSCIRVKVFGLVSCVILTVNA